MRGAITSELDKLRRAPEGKRNDTLNNAALALGKLARHLNVSETKRQLEAVARAIGLSTDEIAATIESGWSKGEQQPRDIPNDKADGEQAKGPDKPDLRPRLKTIDFKVGEKYSPPSYLVKGIYPKQGIALEVGESSTGKTFKAIHLAICVATGQPFFGRRTKKGSVLYVAAEGGSSVRTRIDAAYEKLGGDMAHLRIVTEAPNLSKDGTPDALAATIDDAAKDFAAEGSRLALVVLDTWHASLGGGEENVAADTGAALAPLREAAEQHGALILILHHPGKDVGKGSRGSNSLPAAADAITVLEVPGHSGSMGKPSGAVRLASVTKMRDGEVGAELSYTLSVVPMGIDEDGEPWTTCVVEPHDGPVIPKSATGVYAKPFEDALKVIAKDGVAPANEVRKAFNDLMAGIKPGLKDDALRKAFKRALEKAIVVDQVSLSEDETLIHILQ